MCGQGFVAESLDEEDWDANGPVENGEFFFVVDIACAVPVYCPLLVKG